MSAAPLSDRELAALDALREAGASGLMLADLRRVLDVPEARTHIASFVARLRRQGHEVSAAFVGMTGNTHVYRYTLASAVPPGLGAGCLAFNIVPRPGLRGVSVARVACVDGAGRAEG